MRICYLVKIPSISRNYKDLSITDAELLTKSDEVAKLFLRMCSIFNFHSRFQRWLKDFSFSVV